MTKDMFITKEALQTENLMDKVLLDLLAANSIVS